MLYVGTLDVLERVQDLSANSAVLTKVHPKVLAGSPGGHRHVPVAGQGKFSEFVVFPEAAKFHDVTAEDFSLWTSSHKSPFGFVSVGKETPRPRTKSVMHEPK